MRTQHVDVKIAVYSYDLAILNVVRDVPRDDGVAIIRLLHLDVLLALEHVESVTAYFFQVKISAEE
jgi:hypothetical protein